MDDKQIPTIKDPEDYDKYLPKFMAETDDDVLYEFLKKHSDDFKKYVAQLCWRGGLGEHIKPGLEERRAKEIGLVNYKGLWIEPMRVIPERFKKVIDKHESTQEI